MFSRTLTDYNKFVNNYCMSATVNKKTIDYLLKDKFKDDLFRRMGNVIIQELLNRKRFEESEKKKLKFVSL